jgi:hypothetical protein
MAFMCSSKFVQIESEDMRLELAIQMTTQWGDID